MTEQEEKKNTNWGIFIVLIVAANILSRLLNVWFIKPIAYGIALFIILLVTYQFNNDSGISFYRWSLGSLLLTAGFIAVFFGVPYFFCRWIGAPLTWGLMIFGGFISLRWIYPLLLRSEVKGSLMSWLLTSGALGLLAALSAYFNPESFCSIK